MTAATPPTSGEPSGNGNGRRRISKSELDRVRGNVGKPRPKGALPYLKLDADVDYYRQWLTLAFRPQDGYELEAFDRSSERKVDPCTITFRHGRDRRRFDIEQQADLIGPKLRSTIYGVAAGFLRMADLGRAEASDVWAALCTLGRLETEYDDREEVRKWLEQLLDDSSPLRGLTLDPPKRHDALMAIKRNGEFRQADALGMLHGSNDFPRRPLRFVDKLTKEQWIRAGEAFTYVKWVCGEMRLDRRGLRARLRRIGVEAFRFEDRRPPHPKAMLYRLTPELVEYAEDDAPAAPAEPQELVPRNDQGHRMAF